MKIEHLLPQQVIPKSLLDFQFCFNASGFA